MTRYEIMLGKEPEKVDETEPTVFSIPGEIGLTCSLDYAFYERRILAALGVSQEHLNEYLLLINSSSNHFTPLEEL